MRVIHVYTLNDGPDSRILFSRKLWSIFFLNTQFQHELEHVSILPLPVYGGRFQGEQQSIQIAPPQLISLTSSSETVSYDLYLGFHNRKGWKGC